MNNESLEEFILGWWQRDPRVWDMDHLGICWAREELIGVSKKGEEEKERKGLQTEERK